MTHLSPEQLSALHDGALAGAELAAAEAHLATCEPCRAALAELASLDASLDAALAHDPGEAYFADFAARVQQRIAAETAAQEVPEAAARPVVPAPRRVSWFTPRAFGLVGAAAALVVTAGLAYMMYGRTQAPADLMHADEARSSKAAAPAPLATSTAPTTLSAETESAPPAADGRSPDRPAEAMPMQNTQPLSPRPQAARALRKDIATPETRQMRAEAQAQDEARPVPADAGAPAQLSATADAPAPSAAHESASPAPVVSQAPAPSTPVAEGVRTQKERTQPPASASKPQQGGAGWSNVKSLFRPAPSASTPAPPAPALADDAPRARALVAPTLDGALQARAIEPACGVVRDSRGTPLGGAQITLLGARTRIARSTKDGRFCLEQPVVGDTLLVMRVGYEPVRLVLVSGDALALELQPIGTLGSQDGLVAGGRDAVDRLGGMRGATGRAPEPDMYAHESAALRAAVAEAREAAAVAARDRTTAAWQDAAVRWRGVAAAVQGAAAHDARFRELSALREAWMLTPTREHREPYELALAAFVTSAPRTLPERATAVRWQAELRRAGPASR